MDKIMACFSDMPNYWCRDGRLVYLLFDWGSPSKIRKYSWKGPFQHYSVGLCKFCAAWSASPARTIIYTFEQTFLIISTVLCGAIVFMNLGWLKLVFDLQSLPVDWAGVRKYSLVIGFENFSRAPPPLPDAFMTLIVENCGKWWKSSKFSVI